MTNLTGGTIAANNTLYNFPVASAQITKDFYKCSFVEMARKYKIINDASQNAAKKGKGDEIVVANLPRLDSKGINPNSDAYAQAKTLEGGQRRLRLDIYKDEYKISRNHTISMQRDSTGILTEINKEITNLISTHFVNLMCTGLLYQLGGNTATSISAPLLASTAFVGDEANRARLLTDGLAPTTNRFIYASNQTHANPAAINGTNTPLTIQDIMKAHRIISRSYAGINTFERLNIQSGGKTINTVTLVSETGMYQLLDQSRATGADQSLSQLAYSTVEGGKSIDNIMDGIYIPSCKTLLVSMPDDLMPRAVHSGAENTDSRCCIIVGKGALDFALGFAYPDATSPSAYISVDRNKDPHNDWDYVNLRVIMAGRKVQLRGFGANRANLYDYSTFVIYHSAP